MTPAQAKKLIGVPVRVANDEGFWGILESVNGGWATIRGPSHVVKIGDEYIAISGRRDEVQIDRIEVDPT